MKLFSEMCEDSTMMIFSEMWDWDIEVRMKAGTESYSFQALLHMPDHRYAALPKELWPQTQAVVEKNMTGYRNFPWGKYQVFCADVWLGQSDSLEAARVLARDYLIKMFEGSGHKIQERDQ